MYSQLPNPMIAKVGALFGKERSWRLLLLLIPLFLNLAGCASSAVSRDAESNIDRGVQNARNLSSGDSTIADTYQNSSQSTKGAFIGGAAGAATGLAYGSIGFWAGTIPGAILGASYGAYIDANTTLSDQLINRGANVLVLGDQILLVIPSDRIFVPWTSHIKQQAYSTLNLVTRFLNGFTKIMVKVAVYTDATGSESGDLALSRQQAEEVAKYLTATGLDARMLYAVGCGGSHLVVKNTGEWESDNYRIEITLERLYV